MTTESRTRLIRIAVLCVAASLAFLAIGTSSLIPTESSAAGQQIRGRGRGVSPRYPVEALPEQLQAEQQGNLNRFFNPRKAVWLDIAEDGNRFTPDETPVFDDGLPAFGNEFITEGYIYPAGTLDGPGGVNPDGSPEFPDKVIGRWVCRGWHVGDGAHTETGPWVITHQLFDLGDSPGMTTITTDGYESPEVGVGINRAITGGTGVFSEIRGDSTQVFFGFNESFGVSFRVFIRPAKK